MSSKQEPVLSDISTDDAIASKAHERQTPRPENAAKTGGGQGVVLVLIVLLALFSGYLWFSLQEANSLNTALNQRLEQQEAEVNGLQERLSVTGENANLSVDALKIMLKDQDKEIRKLWDIANKRNKSLIAGNKKAVAKAMSSVSELGKKVEADMSAEKQRANEALSGVKGQVDRVQTQVSQLEQSVLSIPATFELQLSEQKDAINTLKGQLSSLKKQSASPAYDEDIRNIKRAIEALQAKVGA